MRRTSLSSAGRCLPGARHRRSRRGGFTLVEILTVVAIIGILVGLLVPAVNMARRSIQRGAIVFEVQTLANAVEQYKNKFGDYPPDGSSSTLFERHCRKAFPNISSTELSLLGATVGGVRVANSTAGTNIPGSVMDPPEALVFFLGGFSDDPVYPFSGPGGPLFCVNSSGVQCKSSDPGLTSVQYNTDRNAPLFEFKQQRLSLAVVSGATVSNDESTLFSGTNDLLPVYNSGNSRRAPFVYFDSRTYSGSSYVNYYGNPTLGFARPYKSDQVNTTVAYATAPDAYYRYMNDRSFQIISAGLDDAFGGLDPTTNTTRFFAYPTGQLIDISIPPSSPQTGAKRYAETTGLPSPQLDNATNFADGVLENALD